MSYLKYLQHAKSQKQTELQRNLLLSSRYLSLNQLSAYSEYLFLNCWWVIGFAILCFMLYEQGLKKRDSEFQKLEEQLQQLQAQKTEALGTRENLILQVNSQSDPAWVELMLMKGLGVVPEGQKKFFFKGY